MVENLFKELAWKCYQYNLRFEYGPNAEVIYIHDEKAQLITAGWMDGIREKELKHMHKEVDMHIHSLFEENVTEHAQAELTQQKRGKSLYEQKLEEAGMEESDFA